MKELIIFIMQVVIKSDHALDGVPFNKGYSADDVFVKKMNGENLSADEINAFKVRNTYKTCEKVQ